MLGMENGLYYSQGDNRSKWKLGAVKA